MRTESACAGEVTTTVDTAEQTAATVSAEMRAVFLLGKEIPPGTCVGAGTRVERKRERTANATGGGGGDARSGRRTTVRESIVLPPRFLRASISSLPRPLVKVSARRRPRGGREPGGMGGNPSRLSRCRV
ncbi:hypothetical protein GCM10010365_62930 [Streptomyces poonensis]|uniref:Uncharacterized protein n=1 Tax=Streptomyces poonensis TaxID=68255 RepID=A0A918Q6B9_9ACTN|nr:hypothetical protein GCM10010365_62930 [Streptomyces poonensis]GLJ89176.1 hypothetical protein GCM10017589_17760 [Streptomyces poonensis]